MQKHGQIYVQKGVDTALAVDMVFMAAKSLFDVALLISADSDLVAAAQSVKDLGKHVELGVFSTTKAMHLKQICDKTIVLDPVVDKLLSALSQK